MKSPYLSVSAFIVALICLWFAPLARAITVVDPLLIRTNLLNAKIDLAQQVIHEANQQTQIFHLVDQIRQVDDYLKRLGKPGEVNLDMLNEALRLLKSIELGKTSEAILKDFDHDEIFQIRDSTEPKIYQQIDPEIKVDGKFVTKRKSKIFAPEIAARRTFDHYRKVQGETFKRRTILKKKLNEALSAMARATTSSEVQKIAVVVSGLQTQLAATDNEIQFATNEALTRYLQNEVEKEVKSKARQQTEQARLREGTRKDLSFYRLPTKPFLYPR